MSSLFHPKISYVPVAEEDHYDEESKADGAHPQLVRFYQKKPSRMWVGLLVVCALASVGATWTLAFVTSTSAKGCSSNAKVAETCVRPPIRREWRTLARADRNAYIAAVQCLATKPSKLYTNGSRYDDFPRVHQATAPTAHRVASFLPWHRYFVHAYESALKECGYAGVIP